jgi:hypothetical protein
MKIGKKLVWAIIFFLAILLLFAFAPWMDGKKIHDEVLLEKGRLDGTIDRNTGELICDYQVGWVPFGRVALSCEGMWYVTFWGAILG